MTRLRRVVNPRSSGAARWRNLLALISLSHQEHNYSHIFFFSSQRRLCSLSPPVAVHFSFFFSSVRLVPPHTLPHLSFPCLHHVSSLSAICHGVFSSYMFSLSRLVTYVGLARSFSHVLSMSASVASCGWCWRLPSSYWVLVPLIVPTLRHAHSLHSVSATVASRCVFHHCHDISQFLRFCSIQR
jgi:hypothetical protein